MPSMIDNFDAEYELELERMRSERQDLEDEEIDQQIEVQTSAEAAASEEDQPTPDAEPAADPNAEEQEPLETNIFQDVATGVAIGVRNAGVNIAQTAVDLGGLVDSGIDVDAAVPQIEGNPDSITQGLTSGLTQFLTGFVPVVGIMGKLGKVGAISRTLASARASGGLGAALTGSAAKSVAAGAVADLAVWNPQEARFSDLINELGLSNPITEFLASDPDDSAAEGRMKNVLEGMGLGLIAESILVGVRATRRFQTAHATALNSGATDDAAASTVKATYESAAFAREQLDEAVKISDEFAAANRVPTDPVVDEARGAVDGDLISPEAGTMLESAQLRGQTIDEFGAPFDEAALNDSPLGRARAEDPEQTKAITDSLNSAQQRLDEIVNEHVRGVESAEDAVLTLHSNPEYQILPLSVRQEFEQGLDEVRLPGSQETVDAVRASRAADAGGTLHIADPPAPLIDPETVVLKQADGSETVDMLAFKKYVMQRDSDLTKPRSARMIDATSDPVTLRALTAIFTRERAGQVLDFDALGQVLGLNNMNVLRISGDDALRMEADDFATLITTLRGDTAPRSIEQTMAAGELMAKQMMHAMGRHDGWEQGLRNMQKWQNDVTGRLDVTIAAVRTMAETTRHQAKFLATSIINGGDNTPTMADLVRAYDKAVQVQSILDGFKTSAGRTLGSLRGQAGAIDELVSSEQIVREFGGADNVKDLARRMLPTLDNLAAMDKFVRDNGRWGLASRMGMHVWLNAILSGPITFAVNATSATFMPLWSTGELWLQGAFTGNTKMMGGAVRQLLAIPEAFRTALRMNEAGRGAVGAALKEVAGATPGALDRARVDFARDGVEVGSAVRALITEDSAFKSPRTFDIDERRAVTPGNMRRMVGEKHAGKFADDTVGGKMVEWFGLATGMPGRLLSATDELAKAVNYRMTLSRLAWEEGDSLALRGVELDRHVKQVLQEAPAFKTNPHLTADQKASYERMHELAVQQAERNTFTDPLNGVSKTLQDFVSKHPAFKILMPFVRTPSNLFKFVGERTPGVHMRTKRYKDAVRSGNKAELQAAKARIGIGSGLYMMAGIAAYNGHLTGSGPGSPEERAALQATGWQPFSIVIPKEDGSVEYVSYNRADPIGLFLGLAANIGESLGMMDDKDALEVATAAALALAENLKSKSYLTGITAALDALNEPERRMPAFIERFGSSVVPNFVSSIRRTGIVGGVGPAGEADHLMRETEGLLDAIRSKIPGLSVALPPRRNFFGEPITYAMGIGPDSVSPFMSRVSANDPVNREVERLAKEHGFTASTATYKKVGDVELTPQQRDRFIVLATGDPHRNGTDLRGDIAKLMKTSKYRNADDSDDGKIKLIHQLISDRRARAKKLLLREDTALNAEIREGERVRRLATRAGEANAASTDLLSQLTGTPPALE